MLIWLMIGNSIHMQFDKSVMHGGPTYREILNIKIEKRAREVLAFLGQKFILIKFACNV